MSTISLRSVRFDSQTGRLARNIAASERLSALLPQGQVAELLAAYDAATKTVEEARKLRPELPDIFEKLDPTFRAGRPADVAKLVTELAEAQAKRDQAVRTIEALAAIPDRYATELAQLIHNSADGFTERLDEQLQELLNEAEEVLKDMAGVTDASSAIAEDKVEQWKRWIALHESYQALRRDHLELLRASDSSGNFAPNRPAIGYSFFRQLDSALPNFITALGDGGRTSDRLPFAVLDPADPGHWMAVVSERALLEPAVEFADEAVAQASAAARRAAEQEPGVQPEPGRLAQYHGGAEQAMLNSQVARRAREAGAFVGGRVEMDLSRGV